MSGRHGGDIYRNCVKTDFSVNVNPLGIPAEVKEALHGAVEHCQEYPDIKQEQLKKKIGGMLGVSPNAVLCGNGASELFLAVVHAVKPKRTVIPVPSFYGYEHAAETEGEEIVYYALKEEKGYALDEELLEALTEDTDLLFLANPNNPTGKLSDKRMLRRLCGHCKEREIIVLLDECFIDFCGEEFSMKDELQRFDNLIIIRAFTKIFAIPGVRLGYLLSGNDALSESIQKQLPEWNVSAFAQAAGCACAGQQSYIERSAEYSKRERHFLEQGLQKLGWNVVCGEANFLLIYGEKPLYEALRERGVLIRDCQNFRGLKKGYYRIAVKSRRENERLLQEIGEIEWERCMGKECMEEEYME